MRGSAAFPCILQPPAGPRALTLVILLWIGEIAGENRHLEAFLRVLTLCDFTYAHGAPGYIPHLSGVIPVPRNNTQSKPIDFI